MPQTTRTVYGANLQTHQYYGEPFVVIENTTLNEKFSIMPTTYPTPEEMPNVKYLAIGDAGHSVSIGSNGRARFNPIKHRRTDAACFNHIPFVVRLLTNDLTVAERAKYRMRVPFTGPHDGLQYVGYYIMVMDDTASVNMQTIDGNGASIPFEPTSANLNPTIPEDVETTNSKVVSSRTVSIVFTEAMVEELRNVARVLYNDEDEAIVSEIAMVSGIDRVNVGVGAGNTDVSYMEVIAAQVTLHITAFYQLDQHNDGFQLVVNGGVAESLDMVS